MLHITIDGDFIFLPLPTNHTKTCHLLPKLLADGFGAHSRLEQAYSLVFYSFDSSLFEPMVVERLEEIVDRCTLYRSQNENKSIHNLCA